MSRIRTQPLLLLFLVLGFFLVLLGRSVWSLSPSRRCSLGSFALVALHA